MHGRLLASPTANPVGALKHSRRCLALRPQHTAARSPCHGRHWAHCRSHDPDRARGARRGAGRHQRRAAAPSPPRPRPALHRAGRARATSWPGAQGAGRRRPAVRGTVRTRRRVTVRLQRRGRHGWTDRRPRPHRRPRRLPPALAHRQARQPHAVASASRGTRGRCAAAAGRSGRAERVPPSVRLVVRPRPLRNRLACGGRLGAGTIGVAHKTLPCGTRLTLRHRGRTVRVRVIDRGPFVGGREFDLSRRGQARACASAPPARSSDAVASGPRVD